MSHKLCDATAIHSNIVVWSCLVKHAKIKSDWSSCIHAAS